MSNSKPVSTPLAPGARLAKATEAGHGDVDSKLYQGIVGSIMYGMLCTRPDLAFPIQQLSQFSSNPASVHLQAGKNKPCGTSKEPKQPAPSTTERSRVRSKLTVMRIMARATCFFLPAPPSVGKQRNRRRLPSRPSNQNMRRLLLQRRR